MWKRLMVMVALAAAACGPTDKPGTLPVQAPAGPAPTSAAPPEAGPGSKAPGRAVKPPKLAIEAPALVPAPLAGDPARTTIHRLSNGMTVYLSPDAQEPTVIAHIAVRAGSSNDPQQSTGLAHYLEHMLFKGTTALGTLDYGKEKPHLDRIAELYAELRRPGADRDRVLRDIDQETQKSTPYALPNELDQLYSQLGITGLNAFTSNDATVYVAKVPRNRLAQWARVEASRYQDAVFRLFWPELEAVYEEKNRALDSPARQWREAFMKAMFPHHGYGWSSTLGEVEHLKNPAYADMEAFFARYYTPRNMAILLSGDVDESVIPLLEREFAGFQRPAGDAPAPGELAPLHGRAQIDVTVPSNEGVVLGWPLVAATHPDRIALEVMDRLLLDGASGILERELLLPQKVATCGSSPTFLRDAGYFELYADALAGQRHDELERMLLDMVGKLQRGEFSDGELAAAILTADIEHQRALESNSGRMVMMERAFITGEDWHDAVHRIDQLHQVTRDDVTRVARRYLTADFLVVRKVKGAKAPPRITKPAITPVNVGAVRHGAFAQAILDLASAPIEPVAVVAGRDYVRTGIATGPLITVGNARNGLFSVRYDYDVGRAGDRFVCLALEVMRVAGAGTRSADELARALHELGVVVTTSCTRHRTAISVSGIDRNLEAALALVREWLASPVFDDATVKARVATVMTERANAVASPQSISAAMEDYARYGQDTEFLVVPTNRQLEGVTAAQLRATLAGFLHWQHRTSYFGPRGADNVAATAVVLGDGKRKATPRKPLRFRAPHITLVTDVPTAQSHVWLTWPRGPTTRQERAMGLLFAEYIAPALFQDVREARGLAYTVFGGYGAGERRADDAELYAYVGTQGDKAHDAIDAVLETMRRPIDDHRLALAKEALAETHRVERIAPRDLAGVVYRWEDQGEPADPRAARHAAAQNIERAALEAWVSSALGKRFIVSITGDHGKLDDARLARLAPVTLVPVARLFGY